MQVAAERAAAWHFIIDMEVEAPARFQVCLPALMAAKAMPLVLIPSEAMQGFGMQWTHLVTESKG